MSNGTVTNIVTADTNQLIDLANSIIQQCNYPNCSISPATQTKITQSLSTLSQHQATTTLNSFAIPISSVPGRNIFNGYLDLGSAVSSTYLYQCGSTTINSTTCVNNASNVKIAQRNLEELLTEPVTNEGNYLIGLSILASLAVITIMLFLIFLILGIFESLLPVEVIACPPKPCQQPSKLLQPTIPVANAPVPDPENIPVINISPPEFVPVPVNPFD